MNDRTIQDRGSLVDPARLRRRAEEIVDAMGPEAGQSPEETRRTLHDLRVHQIEIEMQNEELQRSQAELEAARTRYFHLYDLAPVGYCTLSKTGLIVEANLTAADLLAASRGDLVRQPISRFIMKDDQDIYYRLRKQIIATREPQVCELRMVKADGTVFWAQLDETIEQNDDSDPVFRIVLIDISARKLAEQQRDAMMVHLAQAQKMEAVGRLAGGVAHDFNNMLVVILGNIELALEQIDSTEPLYEDLQEVRNAAERSATLTRQLLGFACKQTVAPKVIELNESVEGMFKMLRRLIGEAIDLTWSPATQPVHVKIDPSQLDQILANLCVNARDAIADTGKIVIAADTTILDDAYCEIHTGAVPGSYVRLTVSDNGNGIDKDTLQKVFEPFFTTKELGRGTGLGLATIYGIVKQNGGFIDVDSEPGHGTTFRIYLPRYTTATTPADKSDTPIERGNETILLVEDEAAILKLTQTMLERLGYTVLAAATPGDALRLAREHAGRFQLLLTDVIMPEMNGNDLARHLLSLYPGMKHLFMSGYTADIIAQRGVLDEGVHFIQKPFTMQGLAAKVREAIGVVE